MPRIRRAILAALGALAVPAAGQACTVSATGVAFGTYDSITPAPDDGVGSVTLVCHPNVHSAVVQLGTGLSGSYAPRRMRNGANTLGYNLYTSVARNIVWGNGSGGTATVTLSDGIVSAGIRTFDRPIYGRIPAGQAVAMGTYTDTIVVTVIF
jgi:spore coat protein U-like protein